LGEAVTHLRYEDADGGLRFPPSLFGLRRTEPANPTHEARFVLPSSHSTIREATMAKQKATSRAAAKTAVKKKWAGHKTAAKSSSRKTIKSKARGAPASKPKARPKQRIAISHHREEDVKAD